jgi:hypothetical protein
MGVTLKLETVFAVMLIAIEMFVIVAAAILFSTFTTPTLAAIFTIGFYVSGHLNDLVGIGEEQRNNVLWNAVLKVIYLILPNLEHFNIRSRIIYDLVIPQGYITGVVCYGFLYTTLLLLLSIIIFSKKDL